MKVLLLFAVLCWLLALAVAAYGLSVGNIFIAASAASFAVAGVLFSAIDRVISLLTDIRNAVNPEAEDLAARRSEGADLELTSEEDAQEAAWQRLEARERGR